MQRTSATWASCQIVLPATILSDRGSDLPFDQQRINAVQAVATDSSTGFCCCIVATRKLRIGLTGVVTKRPGCSS